LVLSLLQKRDKVTANIIEYKGIFTKKSSLPYTDKDGSPAGRKISELSKDDWLPVSKSAVVLPRFPDPVNPFPRESEE
jgi:hypothetical protein